MWEYRCFNETKCVKTTTDNKFHLPHLIISEDIGAVAVCAFFQYKALNEYIDFYLTVQPQSGIGEYNVSHCLATV